MKLSKNKLNKIRLKRNASRKKHNLRKQKKSVYESSKKRNKRNTHLKRRTLKMYLGGLNDKVASVNTRTGTNDNADIYGQENNVKKTLDTLSQYVCDPNKLDTIVPDDIDEAVKKYNELDNSIIFCSDDNKIEILDKWAKYIQMFEAKFGKKPSGFTITPSCEWLFVGDINYNTIPDTMELAKDKLGQYVTLLQTNNGNECRGSIEGALAIYFDKIQTQFPELTTEPGLAEPATAEPATVEPATVEPATAEHDATAEPDATDEPATDEPATAEPATAEPDATDEPATDEPATAEPATAEPDATDEPATDEPATAEPATAEPDATDEPATAEPATAEPATAEPAAITNDDIKNIFSNLTDGTGKDTISLVKFIKFLKDADNSEAILVRKAIGFDEPITLSEITKGKDTSGEANVLNLSKNSQIFNSLFRTYTRFTNQVGGDEPNSQPDIPANITEISESQFADFINCGQYRDKSKNIFDCKNVKIPLSTDNSTEPSTDNSTEPTDNSTEPSTDNSTRSTDNNGNIVLEVNETEFNENLKRVTVDVFIPREAEVIVRNYAKNTANETLTGLSNMGI